jgi:hypothetical protein
MKNKILLPLFILLYFFIGTNGLANGICGRDAYGSISNGWGVLNSYMVYISASPTIMVRYGYGTLPKTLVSADVVIYPQDIHCYIEQGDNITLMNYNVVPIELEDFSGGTGSNFEVTCKGVWTVAYAAKLKTSGGVNLKLIPKGEASPIGGGIDYSFMYDYSSSNSSSTYFYCNSGPSSMFY